MRLCILFCIQGQNACIPVGYAGASAGSSSASSREYGLLMPSPSHLHCVAAILWHSYELPVDYDLPALLNRELFESVIVFCHVNKIIHSYLHISFCAAYRLVITIACNI